VDNDKKTDVNFVRDQVQRLTQILPQSTVSLLWGIYPSPPEAVVEVEVATSNSLWEEVQFGHINNLFVIAHFCLQFIALMFVPNPISIHRNTVCFLQYLY
jgi:hypothetical protein